MWIGFDTIFACILDAHIGTQGFWTALRQASLETNDSSAQGGRESSDGSM